MGDEVVRTRFELDNLFKTVYDQFRSTNDSPSEDLLPTVQALAESISLQGVLSTNEELDDIDTHDLGFVLADYWIGLLFMKQQPKPFSSEARFKSIRNARANQERFLRRCKYLGLRNALMYDDEDDDGMVNKKHQDVRSIKIGRFKEKKSLEEQRASTTDLREVWRLSIEIACLGALEEMDSIAKEEEMLNMMQAQEAGKIPPPQKAPPIEKPLTVTQVGPNFEVKKQTFQNGVFKPYHRLPTVSLEEYAEYEMKKLEEQEARSKQAEENNPRVMSLEEIMEKGLEDDTEKYDRAIERASYWDDYKDSVPKGSGVTKRF